jgi:Phosphopantothenoylcysteine synthetase/decarboxylase
MSRKILITAGPTYEKIDPVRFIGNYSSGKMGFAIAEECAERGYDVTLVCGPVSLSVNHKNINRIDVESALEMYEQVGKRIDSQDAFILCAAVADYRPETQSEKKIKRTSEGLVIRLVPNPDIAAFVGKNIKSNQALVGFALETNDEELNATGKLERKNLDFIVLNSLREKGAGFRCDTNKITILERSGEVTHYPLKSKPEVAKDIIDKLDVLLASKSGL